MALISGCSTAQTNHQRSNQATAHIESPIRRLEARAELEISRPWTGSIEQILGVFTPGALAQLAPGSPAYQRAMLEHADVVERVSDRAPLPSNAIVNDEKLDPARKAHAIKLYARARAMRQNGDLTQAIEVLRAAAQLDPFSTTIERELGETLLASNDRLGATQAFEKAIELGDDSIAVIVHLASEASAINDHDRVILLASKAINSSAKDDAPIAHSIAGVLLGHAQISQGYLRAGAENLSEALESFDTTSRDQRFKREIIQIMSQRADLWILVGDAWDSIGSNQRALRAYAQAGKSVESPPITLVARQLSSALRQGHPGRASLIFLDHLQRHATDLGADEQAWASALSSIEGIDEVLGSAINELAQRPGLTVSIKRSLMRVQIAASNTSVGVSMLAASQLVGNDPLICLNVLERINDEESRLSAAASVIESNPRITRAVASGFMRTLRDPISFLAAHPKPKTASEQMLIASVGVGLGRVELIEHLTWIDVESLDTQDSSWIAIHAQALALKGEWTRANKLIAALESRNVDNDPALIRLLAPTLIIAQRPTDAWELVQLIADDADASVEDLMLGSQIAQTLAEYEVAAAYLERASQLDPYSEKIYEQLFLLRGSSSPVGNEEDLKFIVRQLGTLRPRSSLFGLIRANELARNGLINDAQELLIELNTMYPRREIGHDLLLSIWKTQSTQGQPSALIDGIAWFESRLKADPNSVQLIGTIARGMVELGQPEHALAKLIDGYRRTGSYELGRAVEQLLSGPLDRREDADAHIVDRLAEHRGVDPTIEYASYLANKADSEASTQMVSLLNERFPTEMELLPAQLTQLTQIVFTLAEDAEKVNNEPEILSAISIIESRVSALSFYLARIKLILISQRPELNFDTLINQVMSAIQGVDTDEQRNTLKALPVQSLLGEGRTREAILLVTRFATMDGTLDSSYGVELYRLLGAVGTNADMIAVLDQLESLDLMKKTIELTTAALGTPARGAVPTTSDEQRADLAYTAAAMASAFDRADQAMSYYELALSYDPNHAWSNNDYGYMLAEKGERMELAVELLERAATAMPNEASIIDSLAWVRYKLGIFEDVMDDQGQVVTRGAISLLMRANQLDTARQNATILFHLGDALWRGGYPKRANDAWLGAEDILRSRIRLINAQANPNPRALESLSNELREIRYRIQDAETTQSPKVAPIAQEDG